MKKVMNKINFAIIAIMAFAPAFAETKDIPVSNDMCDLIKSLQGVFNILRTMAFVGAAFYIAGWAWDFIKGGEAKMDDVKKKGIGLLVGFSLLFLIGIILSFIMSSAGMDLIGCPEIKKW